MKALLLGMVLMMALATKASAGFETGNDLLRICSAGDHFSDGACIGYVEGVVDLLVYQRVSKGKGQCLPPSVEAGQVRDVVVKYLQDNPVHRDADASLIVEFAMLSSFGCKP